MLEQTLKSMTLAALLAGTGVAASAQDFTLRATVTSNHQTKMTAVSGSSRIGSKRPRPAPSRLRFLSARNCAAMVANACRARGGILRPFGFLWPDRQHHAPALTGRLPAFSSAAGLSMRLQEASALASA